MGSWGVKGRLLYTNDAHVGKRLGSVTRKNEEVDTNLSQKD